MEHFLLTPADLTPVLACRGHVNSCGMALLRKTLPYLGYGPVFPESFRLVLKSHLKANPRNHYLFESRRFWAFSPRRVQQIAHRYRQRAGITQPVHPHLFRHQMLTYLTSKGLSDA